MQVVGMVAIAGVEQDDGVGGQGDLGWHGLSITKQHITVQHHGCCIQCCKVLGAAAVEKYLP